MNAERLLEHFEQISEAPDAIARLRRFILDLAVRGKLVEQDPEDEPAAELLHKIRQQKKRMALSGEIKKAKEDWFAAPSYQGMKVPGGWTQCRLDEVAVCLDYKRKPVNGSERQRRIEGKTQEDLFPYFGATQQQGWIDDYIFDDELVLLGEDGVPFFDMLRAKAYVISGKTWVNNHAHVFLPILTQAAYLTHYLNVFDYSGRVAGATRSKLNQAKAVDIPIPLPPLAEQHRIVAKVDELMALCDQLEASRQQCKQQRERLVAASLQRLNQPAEDPVSFHNDASFALQVLPSLTTTPAQIKQLRQTILNLAVRGKLVEQERSADEQCQYLKAIKADQLKALRAKRIKQKVAALASLSDEMLIDNSSCTLNVSLASVIVFGPQNGISPPEVSDTSAPKALTLSATTSGAFDPNCFKHLSIGAEACEPYWLSPGDLLFQRGNTREYVGMAAVYDGPCRSFVYPDLMIRVRISKQVSLRYVHMVLISPDLRAYLTSNATGSSETMPKINQEVLLNAPIPLPPLAEQHRIVAKVDELMALCDQLEQRLSQADQHRRRLLEGVLAEALKEPEPTLESMTA